MRRLPRRIKAEKDSHHGAEDESGDDRIRGNQGGHSASTVSSFAAPEPMAMPIKPPKALSVTASMRNRRMTSRRCAPMAMRMPISRVRSETKRPLPERLGLYTAVEVFRRMRFPFRGREPDWPQRTESLLERAEQILNEVS